MKALIAMSGGVDSSLAAKLTPAQWVDGASDEVRSYAAEYLGTAPDALCEGILRAGMASVADTFIAQMQDYLGLGASARMNVPGTVSTDNWSWRMDKEALTPALAAKLKRLTQLYER